MTFLSLHFLTVLMDMWPLVSSLVSHTKILTAGVSVCHKVCDTPSTAASQDEDGERERERERESLDAGCKSERG